MPFTLSLARQAGAEPQSPAALFARASRNRPQAPALHLVPAAAERYGQPPALWRYGELEEVSAALARCYGAAGIVAGHRVGLLLDNRPDLFAHFLALNRLGASIVPIGPDEEIEGLAYRLAAAKVPLVVAAEVHRKRLEAALSVMAVRPQVFFLRAEASMDPDSFLPPSVSAPPNFSPAAEEAGREAAILFTSGTTGRPKGCVLTNAYFAALGRWYVRQKGLMTLGEEERLVTPLPAHHMNTLACAFMGMLAAGGCLVPLDRFHPKSWWRAVGEAKATIIHYLGVMPAILLDLPPEPSEEAAREVRFGFGAGVAPRHHAAFEERFGFPLIEAWAMTETGAGACIAASREPRHPGTRCFGRPEPGLGVRIVDETGCPVEVGEPGELLVRRLDGDPRTGFFAGYLDDDAETEGAWAGGWFHTGDVVRQDEQGFLYFVERRKNIVRRSGENIAAAEVEEALLQSAAVAAVAVVPLDDDLRGEEVAALVVPARPVADAAAAAEALVREAARQLAYYKLPGWIAFVDSLPTTATQKIDRGAVRRLGRALAEQSRFIDLRALKATMRPNRRKTG